MKLPGKRWLIVAAVVLVVVVLAAFVFNRGDSTQYFTSPVERGDVRQVVEATGTINAVTSVQVGSQVSGTIASLFADFNSRVKKGQVIAKLDPSIYEGTLLQTKADLQNARASVVSAKANESDVGQIRSGQRVTFKVDAFPQDQFGGQVGQVRMNATTVQNVVTYDTIVNFDNPDLKLFPGMTAYVTIPVASAHNALKVANSALRYKPDLSADEIQKLYSKYGIQQNVRGGGRGNRGGGNGGGGNSATGGGGNSGGGGPRAQAGASAEAAGGTAAGAAGHNAQPRVTKSSQSNDVVVVWKLRPDKTLEPVQIQTGITDHTSTAVAQVLHGDLQENVPLVTGSSSKSARSSSATSSPLGGPPRGGR